MQNKKSLVIVESPTKAKTINKYLGKDYVVKFSMGHLVDLPKSRLAVDVDDDFRPDYITIRGRGKILNELKKEAKRSLFISRMPLKKARRAQRYKELYSMK